jgi:hypothetical protein
MTRRSFVALVPLTIFLPKLVSGQPNSTNARDGADWKSSSQSMKLGYVIGFVDAAAWASANVDGALAVLKSLSQKDRKMLSETKDVWNYFGIKYRQLTEGMDSFYADYRNSAIKWDRALSYVRDTINGEPQDSLERELEFERKLALPVTEKK